MLYTQGISPYEAACFYTKDSVEEDPFFFLDTRDLHNKLSIWRKYMPRIKPFYAVKCNDNPEVLKVLAGLDIGFDVSSMGEMMSVLKLGVDPSNIVYAQPCKFPSHLEFSKKHGINLMTFDNEDELYKIIDIQPEARLLLRVRYDGNSKMCLGSKFGADPKSCYSLLKLAKNLELNVDGVAFHVGSAVEDGDSFTRAIEGCRLILDQAETLGFTPTVLDIGGGFPTEASGTLFNTICKYINQALDEHFPQNGSIQVIAEPGRYMVGTALTLVTMVTSRHFTRASNGEIKSAMYYINDGVFGSFSKVYTQSVVFSKPTIIRKHKESDYGNMSQKIFCSIVWGPSCTSYDVVNNNIYLPLLNIGDYMVWPAMGDYVISLQSSFNGFSKAIIKCCIID